MVVRRVIAEALGGVTSRHGGGGGDGGDGGDKTEVDGIVDAIEGVRQALGEDTSGPEDGSSSVVKDAIDMIARPSQIPARISDALHASRMLKLGDSDDEDDGGFVRLVLKIAKPIIRVILWCRSSLIRPLLLVIPEWVILIYLVGRNVAVAVMAVRVKRHGASLLNDDFAFANLYSACAVVFGVLSIALFALLAGRSVSTSVFAVVLSSAGVCASALLDHLLRSADTASFLSDEATAVATQRRVMFLHGGAGLAFSAVATAIPSCCPF